MKDYLRGDTLPVGTGKWLQKWRTDNNLLQHWMSLYVLEAHAHEESLSRFIIFVSANEAERDAVEDHFQDWMNQPEQAQYFEPRRVAQTQTLLPEGTENSIIVCRRSRMVLSADVLPHFAAGDNNRLRRDLLRSLWQIIVSRASRLPLGSPNQTWEYFGRHRLVPSIYLPPDSAVGVEDLNDAVAGVVKTILFHRDKNFDDYALFAGTNELFQPRTPFEAVGARQLLPQVLDNERLTKDLAHALQDHWR